MPVGSLGFPRWAVALDLLAKFRHPRVDASAVEFDLRLTRPAGAHSGPGATDLPTGLARHGVTPASETWEEVFELREFDLGLALAALGVLAEDIEDDGGAVDDLHLDDVLEGSALAWREFGVGDDRVCAECCDDAAQLLGLSFTQVGARIRVRTPLQHAVQNNGSRGLGEGGELPDGVLRILERPLGVNADEHDVLDAELPVLDLGDILEFRRQSDHTAQRLAVFAIELVTVVAGVPVRVRSEGVGPSGAEQRVAGGAAVSVLENPGHGVVAGGKVRGVARSGHQS